MPQRVQADRGRQFRALRRGLERTQRIAWITWLAQLCCERVRSQLPHRASLSRSAICLVRRSRKTFSAVGRAVRRGVTSPSSFRLLRAPRPPGPGCPVLAEAWRRNHCRTTGGPAPRLFAAVDKQSEKWGIAAAFRRNQKRAHLIRRQVGSLLAGYLGASHSLRLVLRYPCRAQPYRARRAKRCTRCGSRTQPARDLSASTVHASIWDGRSLSSGFVPILAPIMCV